MHVLLEHLPTQSEFYHCEDEGPVALVGGLAYGKTHVASDYILKRAAKYPRARHFIFSNTYPQLMSGTLKTFYERCDHWGLRVIPRVRDLHKILIPQFSAEIEVWSVDRPINFKSLEISSAWIDEAQAWSRDAYEKVLGRLRGTATQRRLYPTMPQQIRITANPPRVDDHWLVELTTQPVERTGKPAIKLFNATTFDNPFVSQAYIDWLLDTYDPELVQIDLYGKYGNLGRGKIYRRFDRAKHLLTPEKAAALGLPALEWDPNIPVCWSHDFNIDPLCSVLFQWRRVRLAGYQTDVMYVLDEMRIQSAIIDDAVKAFVEHPAARIARRLGSEGLILYGDPAGNQGNRQTGESDWAALKNGLAREGFSGTARVPDAAPRRRDRFNAANAKFENARGEIGVIIHEKCKFLARDFDRTYYKPGTSDPLIIKPEPGQPYDSAKMISHLGDGFSYPIEFEYGIKEDRKAQQRRAM